MYNVYCMQFLYVTMKSDFNQERQFSPLVPQASYENPFEEN